MQIRHIINSVLLILLACFSTLLARTPNHDDAVKLVQTTVEQLKKDPAAVIQRINEKDPDFLIKDLENLYVFVYDENINMLAHPVKPQSVGKCWKGKKDASGSAFRDSIQAKALSNGKGWQEYIYQKPSDDGLQIAKKTTYFELVNIADKKYIVCVGVYAE